MPDQATTRTFADLPDAVAEFVFGMDSAEAMQVLEDRYDLPENANTVFARLLNEIVLQKIAAEDLPQALEKRLEIDADTAKKLAVDFVGHLLLPISIVLDGTKDLMKKWGGSPADYKDVARIELPKKTSDDYLNEVLAEHGFTSGDDRFNQRLIRILKSYINGIRDRIETVQTLGKPMKTGGLDLAKERAETLVDILDEDRAFVDIVEEIPSQKLKDIEEDTAPKVEEGDKKPEMAEEKKVAEANKEESKEIEDNDAPSEPKEQTSSKQTASPSTVADDEPLFGEVEPEESISKVSDTPQGATRDDVEPVENSSTELSADDVPLFGEVVEPTKQEQQPASPSENDEPLFGEGGEDKKESKERGGDVEEGKERIKKHEESEEKEREETAETNKSSAPKRIVPPPIVKEVSMKKTGEEVKERGNKRKPDKAVDDAEQETESVEGVEESSDEKGEADVESAQETKEKKRPAKQIDPETLKTGPAPDAFDAEDAAEIERHKSVTKEVAEKVASAVDRESAVNKVMQQTDLTFEDSQQEKRFKKAVDARMRDVRDAFETRAQLEDAPERGGVGLSGRELSDAMTLIEGVYSEYHTELEQQAKEKTKTAVKEKGRAYKERRTNEQKERSKKSEKRYREIAARTKPKKQGGGASGPAPDGATVDAAKEAAKAAGPTPRYSEESIDEGGRPKVQDVRFERKLAGPVEQLAQMRLVDFRRLAPNPKSAIKKIKDDIDLLAEQGTERRIAGVKAWRKSPVSQEYARLSMRALKEGKSVMSVVEEEQENDKETLTQEEVRAVLQLNADLRF